MVSQARQCAREGRGLPAARLAKLQKGLAKLRAEGVLEGIKAAKAAKAQRIALERRQAAKPPPAKRRRTSTEGEPVGGCDSDSDSGGGGGGEAVGLGSRFQAGVDVQAADV